MSEVAARVQERIGRREQQARAADPDEPWPGDICAATAGEDEAIIAAHGPAWVLADCERDRRTLARAVAQAERHRLWEGTLTTDPRQWCEAMDGRWPCLEYEAAAAALADLDVKYEAWA